NGVESTCLADGGMATRPCTFGCAGARCNPADDCAGPGDVGLGGAFSGDSSMLAADSDGTCAASSGPDLVTSLTLADWRTVSFDSAGSAFDTVLYTRTTCGDPATELPLAGPCPGAVADPLALACSANAMAS